MTAKAAYTLQSLRDMLGISRSDVMGYVRAGFVTPTRGPRNTYRFGFQDVVLLRTAQTLRDADISAARVRKSLQRLRELLPVEMPLSGLRITAVGDDIAVRENGQPVAADSGQLLFDFEVAVREGSVLSFPGSDITGVTLTSEAAQQADQFLERGASLVDAGSLVEALDVYEAGLKIHPANLAFHFNRAVVLEDLERIDEAVAGYQQCIETGGDVADAHWNLARLYEIKGVKTLALRHFSAYRRLSR